MLAARECSRRLTENLALDDTPLVELRFCLSLLHKIDFGLIRFLFFHSQIRSSE